MLCPVCNKNHAVTPVERQIGNKTYSLLVCLDCERKARSLNVAEFKYLVDMPDNLSCPVCGRTYRQFSSGLLLGCPHCYKAFERQLIPFVSSVQGK
ncbi:MAG: hypothetical protein IJ811_01255 [Clostridia bacterium]|nr:hypothetical protein [Clostridia bacterium]